MLMHWPVVFAVDMACDVTAHVEVRHPKLANALWGERRGCFQKPHPRNDPQVCIHIDNYHSTPHYAFLFV